MSLNEITPDFVDRRKLAGLKDVIASGIKNHSLLQKFSSYRWPYWICGSVNENSASFGGAFPPILINHSHRNWIYYTNFLSSEALLVDPVGMVSTTYDAWSLETWVVMDTRVFRPQERPEKVNQSRDISTLLLNTAWKEKEFQVRQCIYGAKTSIDEGIIETECSLSGKAGSAAVILVVRPYNHAGIGDVSEIEYKTDTGIIRINGMNRLALDSKPDFVSAGDGAGGDADVFTGDKNVPKAACNYGMATLALGYRIPKEGCRITARISLNGNKQLGQTKVDFARLKKEFSEFAGIRIKNGFNLVFPDVLAQRGAYGAKAAILNFISRAARSGGENLSPRRGKELFYIAAACNRAGYFPESGRVLQTLLNGPVAVKTPSFENLMVSAYGLTAAADYFIHSRDMDFLQGRYSRIREISEALYNGAASIKNLRTGVSGRRNSIEFNLNGRHSLHDALLLSFSMRQFSYLARCMGLFGDEIKYQKGSDRLDRMILAELGPVFAAFPPEGEISGIEKFPEANEFDAYAVFAGYPFRPAALTQDNLNSIMAWTGSMFPGLPLHLKSLGGWDTLLSAVYAVNLLLCRDMRCYDILDRFLNLGGSRFALPEVINPRTGMGVTGAGDSPVTASAMFMMIRNMLFMDSEKRLDVLPLPRPEWFNPGSEIAVQAAPSRFGPVNFRVSSSANEVQFRFTELPKFVPPEIALNLPFKARIREENDFVIKKESHNTFVINGWPSVVRFIK